MLVPLLMLLGSSILYTTAVPLGMWAGHYYTWADRFEDLSNYSSRYLGITGNSSYDLDITSKGQVLLYGSVTTSNVTFDEVRNTLYCLPDVYAPNFINITFSFNDTTGAKTFEGGISEFPWLPRPSAYIGWVWKSGECHGAADCNAVNCPDCSCDNATCTCTSGWSGPNCETQS